MDVFKGQMTPKVLNVLKNNHILLQSVPANFTHLFQPLDVQGGPNGYVKRMMKQKFLKWYTAKIMQALDAGKPLAEIEVDLKLSIVKPLHAKWIIEVYNQMTSEEGKKVCLKGWQVSGIKDAGDQGLSELPSLDPFADIDHMLETGIDESEAQIQSNSLLEGSKYISEPGRDGEEESDCEYVDGMKLMMTKETILSLTSRSWMMMTKMRNEDHKIFFHLLYLGRLSRKHITSSTLHFNYKL
ncbi:uncharacterized protein LOC130641912 isoform X1 [Hydractinia symbiolongicarpus]|uniref:uncharacterized protein LOC130641912 isoform X1 n=1 Tax=Hydractinia symbiolongicarpus TaxID=13093 RepID=UPI00254DC059|nr:uncharacterized protein LOC130641912 isoform X1 [Hydractinia symbiolongicarpus]